VPKATWGDWPMAGDQILRIYSKVSKVTFGGLKITFGVWRTANYDWHQNLKKILVFYLDLINFFGEYRSLTFINFNFPLFSNSIFESS
jgi:hypothetical protein